MKIAALVLALLTTCLISTSHAQWAQTSGPETGPVSVLATDPVSGYIFAIANETIFRSQNGGAIWESLLSGLPGNFLMHGLGVNGSKVFVSGALGPSVAIYRSSDNGDHWAAAGIVGLPFTAGLTNFWINGSTILVGMDGNGVYKSTDDGDTWSPANTGIPASTGISQFAAQGSNLYAGSSLVSSVKGIYLSTNGGSTWTPTNTTFLTGITSLSGLSANSSGVFAATNFSGIYRTTNDGGSWQKVNTDAATNFSVSIVATSTNVFAGTAGSTVYRADQNGDNWAAVNTGLPTPSTGLAVVAMGASGASVVAAEGKLGIYRTTDLGANWARSNTGLRAAQISGMMASGSRLYASAEGSGFYRTANDGGTWTEIVNGMTPYVGYYDFGMTGSTLLGGVGAGKLYRSDDNGDLWTLSNAGLTLTGTFVFVVDAVTPTTVYAAGYYGVVKSIDSGLNWTTLNTGFANFQTVLALWKDGSYMLAGANAGFKRSTDSGDTWTAPYSGLPGGGSFGAITQLHDTLYVATSLGIYRSIDHGETWVYSGLAAGVTALLTTGEDLYAALSTGILNSTNGGNTWTDVSQGLPTNSTLTKLAVDDTYLYAGAMRTGVWRRPLNEIGTTPVLASVAWARAEPGRVNVRWHLDATRRGVVYRREPMTSWNELQTFQADGLGFVTVQDGDVAPGARYGYLLGWTEAGEGVTAGEVWVDVPPRTELVLHGTRPSPVVGKPEIAFTIPVAGRVMLELFEVTGRRVGRTFEVDLSAGYHVVPVSSWATSPAGVYVAKLSFGGESRTARIVMTR